MSVSTKIILPVAALTIAGGLYLTSNPVSAQTDDASQSGIIARIAQRFNLNEDDVRAFAQEERDARKAAKQERRAAHLASLVEAGTLTQEQADELVAMKEAYRENNTERPSQDEWQSMSDEEKDAFKEVRQAEKEAFKAEMEAWADAEGINLEDLKPEGRDGFGKRGRRGGFGR